jgi:hypothetical protein
MPRDELRVYSPEWRRLFMTQFGFKAPWLNYYGIHFEFERLDKQARFLDAMDFLEDGDDDRMCFLLQHAHTAGPDHFKINNFPPFKRLLEKHNRKYNTPAPIKCGNGAAAA